VKQRGLQAHEIGQTVFDKTDNDGRSNLDSLKLTGRGDI